MHPTARPRSIWLAPLLIVAVLGLTSCEGSVEVDIGNGDGGTEVDADGFFLGLWHGFIAPFTGIASLFDDDVDVYSESAGGGYPIGFGIGLILIISILLGGFAMRRR